MTPLGRRSIAKRAWNLSRLLNVSEGFTRKEDTLPESLLKFPSAKGPSKGQVVNQESFERMLDEYYEIVGWDRFTGIPTSDKLMELGIENLG